VHIEEPGETELTEANVKNKDKTVDLYCMPFKDFIAAIKTQAETAPEEDNDEGNKEGKPDDNRPTLKLEMNYKFKIPEFCTHVKKFVSDEVLLLCK